MFIALYDACSLYSNIGRDFLIRAALEGTVIARWTERILEEVFDHLTANRPDLDQDKLARTRARMNDAILDVSVTGYDGLADALEIPDPGDRHVLAAAIRCGAQVIVTENIRDFPAHILTPLGIEAKTSDDFLVDQDDLRPGVLHDIAEQIARTRSSHRDTPVTAADIADNLEHSGLLQTAEIVRAAIIG